MNTTARPFGAQLRDWRQRRNLSQLALACDAELSSRHLSFLETGRSIPSREMVLRLADRLDIPLRDQNSLLLAAGFAPAFPTHSWEDPALDAVRQALQTLLTAHEPYPALAIDRHWSRIRRYPRSSMSWRGTDDRTFVPSHRRVSQEGPQLRSPCN